MEATPGSGSPLSPEGPEAPSGKRGQKLTYIDKFDFIKILNHGLPHASELVASANRDTARGTHMRDVCQAVAWKVAKGTSSCRAGVRGPLKATFYLRQHVWRNIWSTWSAASPEGSTIRERVRAFGVRSSEIDGRIVQVLERKFKTYLGEALKVQDQIMKADLTDATQLQTMEAAAVEVPVMGLHLRLALAIAKEFNCVHQSLLTSMTLRSNCFPKAEPAPGADAAEAQEGSGAAGECVLSPRSESADAGDALPSPAPWSVGRTPGGGTDELIAQPGCTKRTREDDGIVSPPPKRQLKQVVAQVEDHERVPNPEVQDWVSAVQSGDLNMLTKLLILVQDSTDSPVLLSGAVPALPTIRKLSLSSWKGQFAKELEGITCFPPRLMTALRLGHRISVEQAHAFSAALHMEFLCIADANSEFARLLKAAVQFTQANYVAHAKARSAGAAAASSTSGAAAVACTCCGF